MKPLSVSLVPFTIALSATVVSQTPRGVVASSVTALTSIEARTQVAGAPLSVASTPAGPVALPLFLFDQSVGAGGARAQAYANAGIEERNGVWSFGTAVGLDLRQGAGGIQRAEVAPYDLLFRLQFQGPIEAELEVIVEQEVIGTIQRPTSTVEVDLGNDGTVELRGVVGSSPLRIPVVQSGGVLDVRIRNAVSMTTSASQVVVSQSIRSSLRGTACLINSVGGGCGGNLLVTHDVGGIVSIGIASQPGPTPLAFLLAGTQRAPIPAFGCTFDVAPALIIPLGTSPMTFDAFALRPLSIDLQSIELYPGLSPRSSPVVVLRCP